MDLHQFLNIISRSKSTNKTFLPVNFGCRVNAAETNQLSQILANSGFSPLPVKKGDGHELLPSVILVNTCSVTQKGEKESLSRVRFLRHQYPDADIFVTGCANLAKVKDLTRVYIFDNKDKEAILSGFKCAYTSAIKDKFTHDRKFLLKIQSGCTQFCSYCTVPYQRQYLWSLSPDNAVSTVNKAVADGYRHLIITGVNIDQYQYKMSYLLQSILENTAIPLISFGSLPINSIDEDFINLLKRYPARLSHFLHIPIQSGADQILGLMKRPYDKQKIISVFTLLNSIDFPSQEGIKDRLTFGTDIIVGFPGETDEFFQETYDLCRQIGFSKIHTFRFSPRPGTLAQFYSNKFPRIQQEDINRRSRQIRSLITTK